MSNWCPIPTGLIVQLIMVVFLTSPVATYAADSEDSLVSQFWQAIDEQDNKALRKLVTPEARDRNLNAYLDQYIKLLNNLRSRYPDDSAYGFRLIAENEMKNYDASVPALFKDDQLEIYPMRASAFLELTLKLDSGLAEIDVLPVSVDGKDWGFIFPAESIAWPGLEQRFRDRMNQPGGPSPLAPNSLIPLHVELPVYPPAMTGDSESGCARVGYSLQPDGVPFDIETLQSEPTALPGKAARKAFRKWKFIPGGQEVKSEFLFLFLADSEDIEVAAQLAQQCGGTLNDSFLITPTGLVDPARIPQFQQNTPDTRY